MGWCLLEDGIDSLAGQLIAMAAGDGKIRLYSAYSGKSVHQLNSDAASESKLSCLGWAVNFADNRATHKRLHDSNGELSLDNLLNPTLQSSGLQYLTTDLPRELALLDLEASLPKLSILPLTGDEYGSSGLSVSVPANILTQE
jgi:anaphase-promoting complex subunit 4